MVKLLLGLILKQLIASDYTDYPNMKMRELQV
jgi:hypothetical protein